MKWRRSARRRAGRGSVARMSATLPTPRVEVYPGVDGRFYSRLVKRGGRITETGSGGRHRGWASRRGARRQAAIDHPDVPVVSVSA